MTNKLPMYSSHFIFQLSPNKKDRYEPLRSISSKLSPVIGGLSGSKSFGEHLSGVGNFINKPMMAISKKLTNNKPVSIYWKVCIEVGDQSKNSNTVVARDRKKIDLCFRIMCPLY